MANQALGVTPSSGYSLAKGGLHALTGNLALELAPHQIRVNAVAPAVVVTPIYERFVPKDKLGETLHSFDSFHPARPDRHRPGHGQHHYVPAVPRHQLGRRAIQDVDGGVMAGRN